MCHEVGRRDRRPRTAVISAAAGDWAAGLWAVDGLRLACGGASVDSDLGRKLAVDVRAGQADGNVIAVDLEGPEYLECDLPLSGRHDAAASEEGNSLAYHFYMAWRAANPEVGDLRFGQAIEYKHPLLLGGADEAEPRRE